MPHQVRHDIRCKERLETQRVQNKTTAEVVEYGRHAILRG